MSSDHRFTFQSGSRHLARAGEQAAAGAKIYRLDLLGPAAKLPLSRETAEEEPRGQRDPIWQLILSAFAAGALMHPGI